MGVNDYSIFDGNIFTLSTVGSSTVSITSSACPGLNVLISGGSQRNCGNYIISAKYLYSGGTGISGTPSAMIQITKTLSVVNNLVLGTIDGAKISLG